MAINPGEEFVKRDNTLKEKLFSLTAEHYELSKALETIRKRMREIDLEVTGIDSAMKSNAQASRDFDTYLAVEKGAITLDQLKEGIELGSKETKKEK